MGMATTNMVILNTGMLNTGMLGTGMLGTGTLGTGPAPTARRLRMVIPPGGMAVMVPHQWRRLR